MPFDSETAGKADPISLASQSKPSVNGANLAELRKGDVRKLRIGITPGRGRNVLPILLPEFRRRYYLLFSAIPSFMRGIRTCFLCHFVS